jgi:cell volume regulation protein A
MDIIKGTQFCVPFIIVQIYKIIKFYWKFSKRLEFLILLFQRIKRFINMSNSVIIVVSILLLIAYLFDLTSSKTKIPSVILLLLLGWIVKQITTYFAIPFPDLTELLPILGTIGLILIVLEGSLELEFDQTKIPMIKKSSIMAFFPMLVLSIGLAFIFHYVSGYSFKNCLANAIPLAVISSAIAIPSANNLNPFDKEFVIYETSLSDILGVIFFNFIVLNDNINSGAFGVFIFEIVSILVISFVATIILSFLLNRINHHIKFGPIIIMILLIYGLSKVYHLPGLIFILLFGLFLNNLDRLTNIPYIHKLEPEKLHLGILQ